MNERELQVLEQYPFAVEGSCRIRGAFLLDTSVGKRLIREFSGSTYRLEREQELLEYLRKDGFLVDRIEPDREGRLAAVCRENARYFVKEYIGGRECDTRSESEILKAVSLLAGLHNAMRNVFPVTEEDRRRLGGPDILEEMKRHNRELRKIYSFIRKKNRKNIFETAYITCFPDVIQEAQETERVMEASGYGKLREQAMLEGHLCHGEYVHHNILVSDGRMAVVNFEKLSLDVQISDLYLFLRKILEKQNYDLHLGRKMLRAYENVKPLNQTERE